MPVMLNWYFNIGTNASIVSQVLYSPFVSLSGLNLFQFNYFKMKSLIFAYNILAFLKWDN